MCCELVETVRTVRYLRAGRGRGRCLHGAFSKRLVELSRRLRCDPWYNGRNMQTSIMYDTAVSPSRRFLSCEFLL